MGLKCFVAMAFGKKDTDILFEKTIKPIFRKNNITPIRIDKLNHNDEINVKLIGEMNECAFGLADLTYARPSVYYEAGYISAKKKVIYICRKDHFKEIQDDPNGNLAIHFDLKMKNIIDWSKPEGQKDFTKRLENRIKVHFGPVIRSFDQEQVDKKDKELFLKKSNFEKIRILNDKAADFLLKNKFRPFKHEYMDAWVKGMGRLKGLNIKLFVRVYENLTTQRLHEFSSDRSGLVTGDANSKVGKRVFKIIICLNKLRKQQVGRVLRRYSAISERTYSYSYYFGEDEKKVYKTSYLFFDDIKSDNVFDQIKLELKKII
jgi:nucleoside 2-deoxyribosyltransferase